MRGSISDNNPWTVPFNRCKLFVRSRSIELSSDIYDREAITRMMAGFHQGLRLGTLTSLFIFSVCFILLIKGMPCWGLPLQEYKDTNIEKSLICLNIISAFFFLFNRYHLLKIEENFHLLRMSESEAVFDSYIIAKSLPIDQTRNANSSEW